MYSTSTSSLCGVTVAIQTVILLCIHVTLHILHVFLTDLFHRFSHTVNHHICIPEESALLPVSTDML